METAQCSSCGAAVIFATVDGKRQILNKRRERAYVPHAGGMHLMRSGPPSAPEDTPLLVHISHFTTCPNAKQHSKGGR